MKKILVNIISKLQQRFNLRAVGDIEDYQLSDTIVPVTQIDELLKTIKITRNTVNVAGTGFQKFYEVPAEKRITIHFIHAIKSTGTYYVNAFEIYDPVTTFSMTIYLESTGLATELIAPFTPFTLEAGWEVKVNVNSYTGAGDLLCKMLIEEETTYGK